MKGAQGNLNPTKTFINHAILRVGNKYYDTSYGTKFDSGAAWEDASIEMFGAMLCKNPDNYKECRDYDYGDINKNYKKKDRYFWMGAENKPLLKESIFKRSKY